MSTSRNKLLLAVVGLIVLSFALSALSGVNQGWPAFLFVLLISSGLVALSWWVLRSENPPPMLYWLTLGAIVLRLALGSAWFITLPVNGYPTEVQQAGYVMEDAYNRDTAAWDLARSDQPLLSAFASASSTDQYGGLLFLSAGIYRYLGAEAHQPLLVVVLAATVSGLAVAFTWAFSRRLWGDKVASLGAWGLALYPEAVLLGSSQMREAFLVCLVPLALYALYRFRDSPSFRALGFVLLPILISIPFNWTFTPSLLLAVGLLYLALQDWQSFKSNRIALGVLICVVGLGLLMLYEPLGTWLVQSARWQAYVSENASGWLGREFEELPLPAQVPLLVGYGLLRPLLPAALVASAPMVWMAIGIWRAVGWTLLLGLLVYATYLVARTGAWRRPVAVLLGSAWLVSLIASYRGGGDLWDNPRYRSSFAAIQVAVATWAWIKQGELKDPWLRRTVVSILITFAWFLPWYLRRYTPVEWPIVNLDQVIGIGLVSSLMYILWDWLRTKPSS